MEVGEERRKADKENNSHVAAGYRKHIVKVREEVVKLKEERIS